jgi:hypothetical protein
MAYDELLTSTTKAPLGRRPAIMPPHRDVSR